MYVIDHARAIDTIFHQVKNGDTYKIGGNNEWKNLDLVHIISELMDQKLGNSVGKSRVLIAYVTDRACHELRYPIDATKSMTCLGWSPSVTFEVRLSKTVDWYLDNWSWIENITSGEYQQYYNDKYENSTN